MLFQWDLVCDRAYVSDLITSIQMGGLMFGAAAFGQLSDTIGRKKSYFLAYTIMIGFGALSAASVNWQMYAALRFLVGVGFGATMVVNCVYTVEFVGTRWRTFCGTVGFWAVGVMVTSLVVSITGHKNSMSMDARFGIFWTYQIRLISRQRQRIKRIWQATNCTIRAQINSCSPY